MYEIVDLNVVHERASPIQLLLPNHRELRFREMVNIIREVAVERPTRFRDKDANDRSSQPVWLSGDHICAPNSNTVAQRVLAFSAHALVPRSFMSSTQ